jgi:hypothetical protein
MYDVFCVVYYYASWYPGPYFLYIYMEKKSLSRYLGLSSLVLLGIALSVSDLAASIFILVYDSI